MEVEDVSKIDLISVFCLWFAEQRAEVPPSRLQSKGKRHKRWPNCSQWHYSHHRSTTG